MNIILCVSIDYTHANDRTYREYRYMVYTHTHVYGYTAAMVYTKDGPEQNVFVPK